MTLLPNPFFFLINITAFSIFALIPHNEYSQKHEGKVVRIPKFGLWFCLFFFAFVFFNPPFFFPLFCFISLSEGQMDDILHLYLLLMEAGCIQTEFGA